MIGACRKMSNNVETENKGNLQFCWRCGRIIYEDPRGHIGCLNSKCRRLFVGS